MGGANVKNIVAPGFGWREGISDCDLHAPRDAWLANHAATLQPAPPRPRERTLRLHGKLLMPGFPYVEWPLHELCAEIRQEAREQ